MFNKIWNWITYPYRQYKQQKDHKQRLKELREKDPFIYR